MSRTIHATHLLIASTLLLHLYQIVSNNQCDMVYWYPKVHRGGYITFKLAFMVQVVVLLGWL